jgi:hypothetical protein
MSTIKTAAAKVGGLMKMRYLSIALTLALSLRLVGSVRADIPPPPDYVEKCTVANKQTTTSECLACSSGYFALNKCSGLLTPYCYSKVCQTYGASVFSELWCRTKGEGVPAVPADTLAKVNASGSVSLDGGTATAPSSCLPYTPPATPDAGGAGGQGGSSALGGSGGKGGSGGQSVIGGSSAAGGTGGQSVIASTLPAGGSGGQSIVASASATGGTGGQSVVASVPATGGAGGQSTIGATTAPGGTGGQSPIGTTTAPGGTGGQSVVTSAPATGGSGGQSVVASVPAAGGNIAVGLSSATTGAGGAIANDAGKPNDSSGCAVGGWISAKALGPWLLAGLFGAIVMLARRRRR